MAKQDTKAGEGQVPPASTTAPGTAVAVDPKQQQIQAFKDRRNQLSNMLEGYQEAFKKALPRFLTPDKMIRVALTAMSRTPKLMQCTNISIMSSLMTCAQLGVLPDNVVGEAYLIPFDNRSKGETECTVIIGYKGLCALAYRSGQVKSIQARAVYKGDEFDYSFGLEDRLHHIPKGNTNQEEITHFYCVVKLIGGGYLFEVMLREEVEAVRNESANYKFSKKKDETVWGKYFRDMGQKTVLRRLMKLVPLSPEVQRAIGLDEAADLGKQNNATDFMDFAGEDYANDAIATVLSAEEESQDPEDHKARADRASDNTLNLVSGGNGK